MSNPSHPENEGNRGKKNPQMFSQDIQIANLSARVPEKVARGVFTTGVLVLQGATEVVLDFVLRMNQPHQVAARVILPHSLVPQLIEALKNNLENYRQAFGAAPPAMPTPPPPESPPTIEEIYQDLKIADDVMVGAYANSVMIVHTASDFCLEFISNVYPKAVITARVFLSAPQVPVLVNTLTQSWQNMQNKLHQQHPPIPPAP
jgi:Protein of unknown function (DUF3467)